MWSLGLWTIAAFGGPPTRHLAWSDGELLGPSSDRTPIIINGAVEEGFDAAVSLGALGFTLCSGSLVTPRVILTAAHCGDKIPLEIVVTVGEAAFGTEAADPDHALGFVDMVIHPDYVPLSDGVPQDLGENDIAVLVLEADAPVDPIWFRTKPLREGQAEGTEVVSVGFGLTEEGLSGERRSAPLIIDDLDPVFLVSFSNTNGDGANICSGDSGGPQYHLGNDGTWEQWAVHSWGDVNCAASSGSTRTDVVSEWILDQIEAVHGSRDRCTIEDRYNDGICDAFCDLVDVDCVVADLADLADAAIAAEVPGGCATGPGPTMGVGIVAVLLGIRRRRAGAPQRW